MEPSLTVNSYEGNRQTSFCSAVWQTSRRPSLPLAVNLTVTYLIPPFSCEDTGENKRAAPDPQTATSVGSYKTREIKAEDKGEEEDMMCFVQGSGEGGAELEEKENRSEKRIQSLTGC